MRSFVLVLLALILSGAAHSQDHPVPYSDSIDLPDNKAVLIEFTASWCVPCRQMDSTTLRDSTVLDYISRNYLWVVVDVDRETGKKITSEFGVNQYPTFIVLDPANREVLLRILGYKPAGIFLYDLRFALKNTRFD